METASERIRRDTAHIHQSLELSSAFTELMSDALTKQRYLEILHRWSLVWGAVEYHFEKLPCNESVRRLIPSKKSHCAIADIEFVQNKLRAESGYLWTPGTNYPVDIPCAGDDFELAGYCYVARGSSLGSQLISRHIEKRLSLLPDAGATFFCSSKSEPLTWSEWRQVFNNAIQSEEQYASALAGSTTLFENIARHFNNC